MRTCLTSTAIAALIVFGLQSVGWGQQQGGSNQSSRTSVGAGGSGLQAGGTGSPQFSQFGELTRMPDAQSGDFVGVSVEDARAAATATGSRRAGGAQGRDQAGRSPFSQFGSSQFNRAMQAFSSGFGGGRSTNQVRARVRLGFSVPPPKPAQLAQLGSSLEQRLEQSSRIQTRSPMEVSIENGTATLRGVVATDDDRRLAERLARLEPGIRQVDNQLTLAGPGQSPPGSPTTQ